MKRRRYAVMFQVLAVALAACQGAEGPAGPQGPPGPTGVQGLPGPAGPGLNRLVLTGQLDANGEIVIALPASVGTNLASPPLIAAYTTDDLVSGAWLAVNDGWSDTTPFFGVVFGNGVWNAIPLQGNPKNISRIYGQPYRA